MDCRFFVLVDSEHGVRVFTHDCKLVCTPKYPGMRVESLGESTIALSPDLLAIRDKTDEKGK